MWNGVLIVMVVSGSSEIYNIVIRGIDDLVIFINKLRMILLIWWRGFVIMCKLYNFYIYKKDIEGYMW